MMGDFLPYILEAILTILALGTVIRLAYPHHRASVRAYTAERDATYFQHITTRRAGHQDAAAGHDQRLCEDGLAHIRHTAGEVAQAQTLRHQQEQRERVRALSPTS